MRCFCFRNHCQQAEAMTAPHRFERRCQIVDVKSPYPREDTMKGSIGKVAVITGATSGIGRVLERYASGRTVRHRTRFRSLVEMSFLAALACLTGGAMCPQEPPSSTQQLPTPPVQQQATMNVAPPCIQPAPMPRMGYEPKTISNFTTYK